MQPSVSNTQQASLLDRDKRCIWHPFTPLVGSKDVLPIRSAKGVYLYTEDGRAILDAVSSWWVNLHGHSHPHIAEAIYQQANQLEHLIFAGFTHEPAVSLAEKLLQILPANQSKVFYSDNGSTAVEVGLKMAFQFWYNQGIQKKKIIAMDGSYHGDTFGAMSVGDRSPFNAPFAPFLFDVEFIAFPVGLQNEQTEAEKQIIGHFRQLVETGEVAAFIYEPLVQGSSGMRMYSTHLLETLLKIAHEYAVLCIADEVMTGFGRTGPLFASDYLEEKPDIMCLSKGLTGGTMALGVTTCTEKVIAAYRSADLMKTFFHGHSFTANPIACAASLASLELLLTEECRLNRERINAKHQMFAEKLRNHPHIKDIRCLGVILAIEVSTIQETSYFNEARNNLYHYFLDRNLLLRPLGNVIYVLPPYIITNEELERIYLAIEEAIT